MTDFFAGNVRPTSLDDRRRRPRRAGASHDEFQVIVVDGLGAGERHGCVFREITADSACLLVKADLRVGQRVRLQPMSDGVPSGAPIQAEIVRSRPLTTGRFDVLVEYRRPPAAPKPSESQRRHERRQARLARVIDLPVAKTL